MSDTPAGPPLTPPAGQPVHSYPRPENPGRKKHPRWVGLLVLGVVLALLVAAGAIAMSALAGNDTASELQATGPGQSSQADPAPASPDPAADFDATMAELMAFVEVERGLEFKTPPVVEVLDDGEFSARLLEDFDDDVEDLELAQDLYRALGLIEADVDLVETVRSFLDIGVLGVYDPETEELLVRGTDLTPYTQQTVVHELVHALDDQWFDLDRSELDDAVDESSFGFSALVEGNARHIEAIWEESLTEAEREELLREEMSYAADVDIDILSIPSIVLELMTAPYELGQPFVEAIRADGGLAAVDAAFESPPLTSEQVIYPFRYLDGEDAIEVPAPEADGEVIDEGAFGHLVLFLMLAESMSPDDSRDAATGWGGDWYVAWNRGDETCVRVDFASDSSRDREELDEALDVWADDQSDAEVERNGDLTRLTSCG